MRIIAGTFRSRLLASPKGETCRPAMGRTREALFAMLEARGVVWPSVAVLDIFAGSGSLSFEALSRGCRMVTLIEQSREIAQTIRQNIAQLNVQSQTHLVQTEALRFLRSAQPQSYEVVFLDPPYRKNLVPQALTLLCSRGWLAKGSIVVTEVENTLHVTAPESLSLLTERLFGQTRVSLFRNCEEMDASHTEES